jgi:hypothetical protein
LEWNFFSNTVLVFTSKTIEGTLLSSRYSNPKKSRQGMERERQTETETDIETETERLGDREK